MDLGAGRRPFQSVPTLVRTVVTGCLVESGSTIETRA